MTRGRRRRLRCSSAAGPLLGVLVNAAIMNMGEYESGYCS
jgi:hypothetical protein